MLAYDCNGCVRLQCLRTTAIVAYDCNACVRLQCLRTTAMLAYDCNGCVRLQWLRTTAMVAYDCNGKALRQRLTDIICAVFLVSNSHYIKQLLRCFSLTTPLIILLKAIVSLLCCKVLSDTRRLFITDVGTFMHKWFRKCAFIALRSPVLLFL